MKQAPYVCQVCGTEVDPDVVALMAVHRYEHWVLHRIERKGGVIQVLTCPECASLSQDLILESYKERIRMGLVAGFQ